MIVKTCMLTSPSELSNAAAAGPHSGTSCTLIQYCKPIKPVANPSANQPCGTLNCCGTTPTIAEAKAHQGSRYVKEVQDKLAKAKMTFPATLTSAFKHAAHRRTHGLAFTHCYTSPHLRALMLWTQIRVKEKQQQTFIHGCLQSARTAQRAKKEQKRK
eukprot:1158804-Pelagomonas_calceolata.AAC.5